MPESAMRAADFSLAVAQHRAIASGQEANEGYGAQWGSVAKLIVTLCYSQLVVLFVLEHFNIWYSS